MWSNRTISRRMVIIQIKLEMLFFSKNLNTMALEVVFCHGLKVTLVVVNKRLVNIKDVGS